MDLLVGTALLRPYVFAFLALFIAAGVLDLGWRRTLGFTAGVWPVALVAEFSSTRTGFPFGFYEYTGLTRGRELGHQRDRPDARGERERTPPAEIGHTGRDEDRQERENVRSKRDGAGQEVHSRGFRNRVSMLPSRP